MRSEFISGLKDNEAAFGIELSEATLKRLADFYELILENNPILHLVGPCSPTEFATRHVLESLTLLKHLPPGAKLADVGSGGGFPAIPCLIVRDDLSAVLIESKEKKVRFLQTVLENCRLSDRVSTVAKQFSETRRPDVTYITARALDRFADKLPKLIRWSGRCKLLLFGGGSLGDTLKANGVNFNRELMPLSEQRYLFVC